MAAAVRSIIAPANILARQQHQDLRFSECLFLFGIVWAYFFSISEPLLGVQLHISAMKHLPMMFLAPAMALHMIGRSINNGGAPFSRILAVTWPLVCMALFMTAGSLVARQETKIIDTFLTFGTYLLILPLFSAIPLAGSSARAWTKALLAIWLVAAFAALAGEAARLPDRQKLHEIEYVVLAGFFAMWFLARSRTMKTLALLLVITAAVLNHKLTGYILALAGLLFIVLATGWTRIDRRWRGFYFSVAGALALAVVGLLVLGYFEFRDVLPTGSPEVRLHQYEEAWRQFLASPIYGSAYLEGASEGFREANKLFAIPTHSDLMDMLKHGGVIGFGLFVVGYVKIFVVVVKAALATRGDRLMHAYFMSVAFFQVGALITFALNPLLLKPPFLIVIWANLGLAVGLALVLQPRKPNPKLAPAFGLVRSPDVR